jgi:hypothetical protein
MRMPSSTGTHWIHHNVRLSAAMCMAPSRRGWLELRWGKLAAHEQPPRSPDCAAPGCSVLSASMSRCEQDLPTEAAWVDKMHGVNGTFLETTLAPVLR